MHIMLVDDDWGSLKALSSVIKQLGYTPIAFLQAERALCHVISHGCDLVITDLIMPEMDGMQLASKIREYNPQAKIIVVSGGLDNHAEQQIKACIPDIPFLPKPLDAALLQELISQQLQER